MKNSRMKLAALLVAAVFTLTGCGEALYTLTPEEEAIIVSYAAESVAKFNTYQQDGQVFVMNEELEDQTESEQTVKPENDSQQIADSNINTQVSAGQENGQSQTNTSTLTEALDLGVIRADYTGAELAPSYVESDYYAVDASAGKQFLVVHVNLTNTVAQPLHVDILSITPAFQLNLNGSESAMSQTTILLNDLSTYQGDIGASQTVETVLLFEVPTEVTEISSVQLTVTANGSHYIVNL